jgi:hypothetical protein
MVRTLAYAGALTFALSPFGLSAAGQRRAIDLEAADCSAIDQTFNGYDVARATQHTTIPVTAGTLELRPDVNGGVRIEHGVGAVYSVTACVTGGAPSQAAAQAAVDNVRLEVDGARVRVRDRGGDSAARSWTVQLIVTAPDGASIVAETSNGPIRAHDVTGTFDLRASNGPIAVDGVAGDVKAQASNGPIRVTGSRGEFDVETANGPISVTLEGQRWDGHLTARAGNGPLTVSVPANFQSGVEVRSSSHAPWRCSAAACAARGGRDWDDHSRMLHIGNDPVVVRLSTNNGPVTVRDR